MIPVTVEELSQIVYPVSIHLNQTLQEEITGNGNWQSPGTNVNLIGPDPENCSYSADSIQYDGTINVTRYLHCEISVSSIAGGTTVILSAGKNGSPDTSRLVELTLVNANDADVVSIEAPIDLTGNSSDYCDFYIQANSNFYLENAQFRLGKKKRGED